MTTVALGVWCGGASASPADLLVPIGLPGDRQVPRLRITLARCLLRRPGWALKEGSRGYPLIPWDPNYDPLASDVTSWGYTVRRTHSDSRIAMRDLVSEFDADIGVMVYGAAATIDRAEILMAVARRKREIGDRAYISPRMMCFDAATWLLVNHSKEWVEPMTPRDLALFYAHDNDRNSVGIPLGEARAIRARTSSR